MKKISASVRISVLFYLIVSVSGCFFTDNRRCGVQDMAASPYVAALVHHICGRFSDDMGYCRDVETREAGAQP